MRKKLICLCLAAVMIFSVCICASAADVRTVWTDITYRGLNIYVNGTKIVPLDEHGFLTEAFIMNDTTYLPVRAIAKALGLKVAWEPTTSTVVLNSGGERDYGEGNFAGRYDVLHVSITYRGTNISLDGENVPLVNRNGDSVEPFIYNGTNYLPLRVVGEALGLSVGWDAATSTITMVGGEQDEVEPKPEAGPRAENLILPTYMSYLRYPDRLDESYGEVVGELFFEYDEAGRITRMHTGTKDKEMLFTYNGNGKLTKFSYITEKHGERCLEWIYDETGELTARLQNGNLIEGSITRYDDAGRVVFEATASDINYDSCTYTYNDKENSVIAEISNEDGIVQIEKRFYSDSGLLVRTEEGTGYFDYTYDAEGRLIYKEGFYRLDEVVNTLWQCSYSYDDQGRLIKETGKWDSNDFIDQVFYYEYDEAGRPSLIKKVYNSLVGYYVSPYDPEDIKEVMVEESRVTECIYTYNEYGLITRYEETSKDKTVSSNGVVSKPHDIPLRYVESYIYDSQQQLIKKYEKFENGTDSDYLIEELWTYDEDGRMTNYRITNSRPRSKWNGTYERRISYDEKGRMVEDVSRDERKFYPQDFVGWTCKFDEHDRLVEFSNTDHMGYIYSESYKYDELGRIVNFSASDSGRTDDCTFHYDEGGNLAEIIGLKDYMFDIDKITVESIVVPYVEQDFNAILAMKSLGRDIGDFGP